MSCLESRLASVDEFASILEHADRATVRSLAGSELPAARCLCRSRGADVARAAATRYPYRLAREVAHG